MSADGLELAWVLVIVLSVVVALLLALVVHLCLTRTRVRSSDNRRTELYQMTRPSGMNRRAPVSGYSPIYPDAVASRGFGRIR